ncbi:ribose operon repressor [Lysinibacillus contaminans]|uniref:Ribose operon repressor n=1 Tax=Lysinibacillus contaminans TaxID=1293441 RepID=A0ABR5K093_9BACI|nr:LacI family DNA-binding transcriptional regulator [Lysinibacillus contaminans]KOS68284.1 ribose operon repressor [Lysinibacillus contaminans]
MANIKDVAKHASVSVATVSRFLNKKGYVSEAAKESIEAAIASLNYRPNQVARSLSTKRTNLIGLIVPDITNPFFPELARAVEDIALSYGYTIVLCNSDEKAEKEELYINMLTQKYVAGFIVTTNLLKAPHYEDVSVPIVALDRTINLSIPTVTTDNVEGARIGTAHLLACGAKNIVCMRGPVGLGLADDRVKGFIEATADKDVQTHIVECPFSFEASEKIAEKILIDYPDIDGIFASSDTSAIAALKVAQAMGRHVPNDLQIVGFDGVQLGKMVSPGLTTVAQDIYKMGAYATRMLIKMIEDTSLTEKNVTVSAELIVRGTTRKD